MQQQTNAKKHQNQQIGDKPPRQIGSASVHDPLAIPNQSSLGPDFIIQQTQGNQLDQEGPQQISSGEHVVNGLEEKNDALQIGGVNNHLFYHGDLDQKSVDSNRGNQIITKNQVEQHQNTPFLNLNEFRENIQRQFAVDTHGLGQRFEERGVRRQEQLQRGVLKTERVHKEPTGTALARETQVQQYSEQSFGQQIKDSNSWTSFNAQWNPRNSLSYLNQQRIMSLKFNQLNGQQQASESDSQYFTLADSELERKNAANINFHELKKSINSNMQLLPTDRDRSSFKDESQQRIGFEDTEDVAVSIHRQQNKFKKAPNLHHLYSEHEKYFQPRVGTGNFGQNQQATFQEDDVSMDIYIKRLYDFEQRSVDEKDLSIHQQNIYTNSINDESFDLNAIPPTQEVPQSKNQKAQKIQTHQFSSDRAIEQTQNYNKYVLTSSLSENEAALVQNTAKNGNNLQQLISTPNIFHQDAQNMQNPCLTSRVVPSQDIRANKVVFQNESSSQNSQIEETIEDLNVYELQKKDTQQSSNRRMTIANGMLCQEYQRFQAIEKNRDTNKHRKKARSQDNTLSTESSYFSIQSCETYVLKDEYYDVLKNEIGEQYVKKLKQVEIKEKDRFIFRPNDDIKLRWDLVVMVGAIINCIAIPLQVSFDPDEMEHTLYSITSRVIDFLFLLDMIINFRTAFINDFGDEITCPHQIAINYLKFYFWMDLIATIPIDDVIVWVSNIQNDAFRLFGVLKLGRLLKLKKIIQYLNVVDEIKQLLNLMKLIFFLVIYIHCFACVWWYNAKIDKLWIPPNHAATDDYYQIYTYTPWSQYLNCLYMSTQMIGACDQMPRGVFQTCLAAFGIFFAAIINANIFGELSIIMAGLDKEEQQFRERVDRNNTAMIHLQLPWHIQNSVRESMVLQETTLQSQKQLKEFLDMIPPSVRVKVLMNKFKILIDKSSYFENESENLRLFLIQSLEVRFLKPETVIVHQFENNNRNIYVNGEGMISVFKQIVQRKKDLIYQYQRGAIMNLTTAAYDSQSLFTIESFTYCTIGYINYKDFQNILLHNRNIKDQIIQKNEQNPYDVDRNFFMLQVTKHVPYLKVLSENELTQLYYKSHRQFYGQDQNVFEYGSACKFITIILSGVLSIELINNKKEVSQQIDMLGRGSILGVNNVISGNTWFYRARVISDQSLNVIQICRGSIMRLSKQNQLVASKLLETMSDHQTYGIPQVDYEVRLDPLGHYQNQRRFIKLSYGKFCLWQEFCFDPQLKDIEDALIEVDYKKFSGFKTYLTVYDPLKIQNKKKKNKKQRLEARNYEQSKLIKESVKDIHKKQLAKLKKLTNRQVLESKQKLQEEIFLISENQIDKRMLPLLTRQEKQKINIQLIKDKHQDIKKRFTRGLKRIVQINRFGQKLGTTIDFMNFSFGQSIEQTIKSTMDQDMELDELQQAKKRLIEMNGKVFRMETIHFIQIMMERVRINKFFDKSQSIKLIKDQIKEEKKYMLACSRELNDLVSVINSVPLADLLSETKDKQQISQAILRQVAAIEKNLEGNNLMNQLKLLMKTNKSLEVDDKSSESSIDDLENRILSNQAALNNSRPMMEQMHEYEEIEKNRLNNFLSRLDTFRKCMNVEFHDHSRHLVFRKLRKKDLAKASSQNSN